MNILENTGFMAACSTRMAAWNRITDIQLWKAGLYTRLSREDGDKDESDSIANQKDLLHSYAENKTGMEIYSVYEDDGYTGVNFERPDFQRLIADIQAGLVNCVIVKDLSRLGRNHIEMGKLLERFFPFMGVRFIAVNDNYDSLTSNPQTDNIMIPFKNLLNDAYCADTSRKIRSQFEVKRKKGDFIGPFATYGYRKDPENHNHLLIDEEAAQTVRNIFAWKIGGMSQQGISDRLNELGIPSPSEYKKQNGSKYRTTFQSNIKAAWTPVAVGRILKNEIYTGVLIQGITTTPNYKVKKRITKEESDWVRKENTHEAIISSEDFKLVNGLLKLDTRIAPGADSVYLFSGMLQCADCGQNLVRKNVPSGKKKNYYYICSTYKRGDGCKSHSLSETALYDAVFQTLTLHIRECAKISEVLAFVGNMPFQRLEAQRLQRQMDAIQESIKKLRRRQVKLYEDFSDGLISREEYTEFKDIFTGQTDSAEKTLEKLRAEHDNTVNSRTEKSAWLEHFKKYHNLQALTRNTVVELIEKIIVHEGGRIEVLPRYQSAFEDALHYIEDLLPESIPSARRAM